MANVTDLTQYKSQKVQQSVAEDMVNQALQADLTDRETAALYLTLQQSERVVYFSGDDRARDGTMKDKAAEQLLRAAKTQGYTIEPRAALNTLRCTFDGDYIYDIIFPSSIEPEKLNILAQQLGAEQLRGAAIAQQNHKNLLGSLGRHPSPDYGNVFSTKTLALLSGQADTIYTTRAVQGKVIQDALSSEALIDLASHHTASLSYDEPSLRIDITLHDSNNTLISIHMQAHMAPMFQQSVNTLHTEQQYNLALAGTLDPQRQEIIERITNTPVDFGDEIMNILAEHATSAASAAPEDNDDNVHRPTFRR